MNDETFEMHDSTLDLFEAKAIAEATVEAQKEFEASQTNYADWVYNQYEEEKSKELGVSVEYFRMEFM